MSTAGPGTAREVPAVAGEGLQLGGAAGLMARELQLCAVTPQSTVIVYTDGLGRPELCDGFATAAQMIGATVLELRVPRRVSVSGGSDPSQWWAQSSKAMMDALSVADLVVDVSGGGLYHTGQGELLAGGARILRAREPLGRLEALFPRREVVEHVRASEQLLAASSEIHFRSAAGTDLRVRTAGQPVTAQYGYTDSPGRWDHWGTALAALAPGEGEGEGIYVLSPGDVVFFTATNGRYLREPLRIEFREGSIHTIAGGVEARMLNEMLERSDNRDARRLSHLGWGCDPRADWNALQLYGPQGGGGADLRSLHASVVIAFGANLDLGGTSDSTVHVDLATRRGSVSVDGRPVLSEDGFVDERLKLPRP